MPARATSPANSEWGQKPDAPLARLVSDPNRSRLNSVVTRLLTGLCCLAVAANAAAQPPGESAAGPGGWRSLRVPGGVAPLLKAAGLDESLPRTRALRDVIHVLYDTQPGVNDAFDARRRNVITYLESISAVEALGLEAGAGAAEPPPGRRPNDSQEDRGHRRSDRMHARTGGTHVSAAAGSGRSPGPPASRPGERRPRCRRARQGRERRATPRDSASGRTRRPCRWLRRSLDVDW